jgi:hypothetical protein
MPNRRGTHAVPAFRPTHQRLPVVTRRNWVRQLGVGERPKVCVTSAERDELAATAALIAALVGRHQPSTMKFQSKSRSEWEAVIDVAYLMLVGTGGWNQRWEIPSGQDEAVSAQLDHIGTEGVGHMRLLDPETDNEVTFVVAWNSVASAVIVPSPAVHSKPHGQYA